MMRKEFLLVALVFAGLAQAAPPLPKDEAPVEIISAEFGIFDASTPGELAFEPTDVVPHQVGQRYGWSIEVRTTRRSLAVREEYLLPPTTSVPAADPLSASLNIPNQRRSQVSQRQLVPVGGWIYGEWAIGPLEPAGRRYLQVVIEGKPAASFEYEVK
jgi:hypothetical protein